MATVLRRQAWIVKERGLAEVLPAAVANHRGFFVIPRMPPAFVRLSSLPVCWVKAMNRIILSGRGRALLRW
jgi:hypothetical protein